MRNVTLSQPRPDCVAVAISRDRLRAGLCVGALAVVSGLMLVPTRGTFAAMLGLVAGAAAMVVIATTLARALRAREHTLARSSGRLLLDTEPIELARVELKITATLILHKPTGYVLTLWVMTAVGPDEILLGHFATMFEASRVSGLLEDFVQRANVKQHRLA